MTSKEKSRGGNRMAYKRTSDITLRRRYDCRVAQTEWHAKNTTQRRGQDSRVAGTEWRTYGTTLRRDKTVG